MGKWRWGIKWEEAFYWIQRRSMDSRKTIRSIDEVILLSIV